MTNRVREIEYRHATFKGGIGRRHAGRMRLLSLTQVLFSAFLFRAFAPYRKLAPGPIPRRILSLLVAGSLALSQADPSLQPEDFAGMPLVPATANGERVAELSPDGRQVVYVVQDLREVTKPRLTRRDLGLLGEAGCRGCDLFVVELPSPENPRPEPVRLTREGDNWSPAWSPDGTQIAFVSNRDGAPQLWIIPARGGRPHRLSEREVDVAFPRLFWSADGSLLFYHKVAGANPNFPSGTPIAPPDKRVQARILAYNGKTLPLPVRPPNPAALIIDVASGQSLERDMLWPIAMGGRGRSVAWVIHHQYMANTRSYIRILEQFQAPASQTSWQPIKPFNFDLPGGPAEKKRRAPAYSSLPFALTADGGAMIALAGGRLWRLVPGSHQPPQMLRDARTEPWIHTDTIRLSKSGNVVYALGKRKLWKIPLHAPSARVKAIDLPNHNLLRISADGSRLVSLSPDGLRFWRIGDDRVSLEYDAGRTPAVVENLQIGPDGSTAIFIAEGPHTPRDVWSARIGIRAGNLSRLNPSLTGKPMGQVRSFQYPGPDGKIRKGVVILPAGYTEGKRYPTVVLVYPTARYTAHPAKFALGDDARVANPHLLAAHGIAVVAAGMADGRSRRIPELAALVNAAADAAIRNGWSDPNRLGLYGQSDGGFVVNAVITRTTRYRAAVSVAGYADYISRWCSLDDQGNAYGIFSSMTSWGNLLRGTPMSKPRNFIDHSPLFQMDKVRTPLLLLHGRMDPAVPYEQSDEIFVALRAMRQQVEYALYEGEGHHPADWTMPHQLDAAKRILNWYLKFLTH